MQRVKLPQKTEDIVGPYELHDFFLYHFIKHGSSKERIYFLAKEAFKDDYSDEEIQKWLDKLCGDSFTQQFKRSALLMDQRLVVYPFLLEVIGECHQMQHHGNKFKIIWIKKLIKIKRTTRKTGGLLCT